MARNSGSPRKKVVVHAGFPKTGSSAIQLFLSANVTALEKAGVTYPLPERVSVIRGSGGTGNLIEILRRKGFLRRYAKAHAEEIRKQPNGHVGVGRIVDRAYWEACRRDRPEVPEGHGHALGRVRRQSVERAGGLHARHARCQS